MVCYILDTNWDPRLEITTLDILKDVYCVVEEGFSYLLYCRDFFGMGPQ